MEMIIAIAILAASGVALFTLIGQGSLFGRRAEGQSTALQLAQSVMAETLAMPESVESEGTFEQDPRWAYRIQREALSDGSSFAEASPATSTGSSSTRLIQLTVEVFPATANDQSADARRATARLVRWVRQRTGSDSTTLSPAGLP
jgi:Tfp pilus assembly protein PilV